MQISGYFRDRNQSINCSVFTITELNKCRKTQLDTEKNFLCPPSFFFLHRRSYCRFPKLSYAFNLLTHIFIYAQKWNYNLFILNKNILILLTLLQNYLTNFFFFQQFYFTQSLVRIFNYYNSYRIRKQLKLKSLDIATILGPFRSNTRFCRYYTVNNW